jgi:hypothetical protein
LYGESLQAVLSPNVGFELLDTFDLDAVVVIAGLHSGFLLRWKGAVSTFRSLRFFACQELGDVGRGESTFGGLSDDLFVGKCVQADASFFQEMDHTLDTHPETVQLSFDVS